MINVAIWSSSNCFSCVSVAQHSGAIRPLPYFSVCFMKAIDLQLLEDPSAPAHPSPLQTPLSAVRGIDAVLGTLTLQPECGFIDPWVPRYTGR